MRESLAASLLCAVTASATPHERVPCCHYLCLRLRGLLWLASQFLCNLRQFACNFGMALHSTSYPHRTPANGRCFIAPTRDDNDVYPFGDKCIGLRPQSSCSMPVNLLCSWFVPCSFSASMNPHRPKGGPRSGQSAEPKQVSTSAALKGGAGCLYFYRGPNSSSNAWNFDWCLP